MAAVIAHRGASTEEVENSLAAFQRALADGAHGIELDVHATADGHLVVRHDPVLAGHRIASLKLSDVRLHTLTNGEAIPTLDEALGVIAPGARAFVEVKTLSPAHDAHLLDTIDRSPAPDRCHIHGFDHRIVRRLSQQRPAMTFGVLSTAYPVRPLSQLTDAGATELWQEESLIDAELVALAHGAQCVIYAWTVDDPGRMSALAGMGVDGICTNRPAIARAILG